MRNKRFAFVCLVPLVVLGCRKKDEAPLTTAEASQALDEASVSGEAANLISGSVEIATDFTIGQAVEDTAKQIQSFVASQLPCAEVKLTKATLDIEYGALPGKCEWKGLTYSGKHAITVARNEEGDVEVDHSWTDLSNGRVKVSGTANVTWSLNEQSRHVVHELTWTRLSDGLTATGSGDRTQTVLKGGLVEGFQEDGHRSWKGPSGQWDLAISDVEVRWVDPVPQAGSFTLSNPAGKTLSLSFTRVDATTIKVTVTNGDKSFSFDVKAITADTGSSA